MILMGGFTEEGISGGMGQVDEAVCDVSIFFSPGKWAADRRVDSATERHQARVPISPNVVHTGRRCVV